MERRERSRDPNGRRCLIATDRLGRSNDVQEERPSDRLGEDGDCLEPLGEGRSGRSRLGHGLQDKTNLNLR
ncbi:MAG: hypothetical protein Q7S35_11200 [Candidatus Limnocylindrales bacterium]|nr:hypothetical protein [Candidatus Limnocylindrales bacterium]